MPKLNISFQLARNPTDDFSGLTIKAVSRSDEFKTYNEQVKLFE